MPAIEKAADFLKAGRLKLAIELVIDDLRNRPADVRLRTFLFELLCFAGEWDRAEKQLEVIGHENVDSEIGVQVYRNVINAERARRLVFQGGAQPHFFMDPPGYVDLQLVALAELRVSQGQRGKEAYLDAQSQWPSIGGNINGKEFNAIRDCNDLLGPILEIIVRDQYAWLPIEQVSRIGLKSPTKLRDSIWVSAQVEMIDGTFGRMFIPALYVGSQNHSSEGIKLGRNTDWVEVVDQVFEAIGLRMFFTEEFEQPLLGIRSMEFKRTEQIAEHA